MTTAAAVLADARQELGYHAPASGSKFGKAYGIPTGAWCAMFTSVILDRAGLRRGVDFPWHAWTPNGVAWAKRNGAWHETGPQIGDLVYFMWPGVSDAGRGEPPVSHVGFVEAVRSNGSIVTIEGNTSGPSGGSQYNGGTVQRKVRKSYIVGYVTVNYGGFYDGDLGSRVISPGAEGDDVKDWQNFLNGEVSAGLEEDGVNGPLTLEGTKVYQRSVGIDDDGVPGPITFDKAGFEPATPAPAPAPKQAPAPADDGYGRFYKGKLGTRRLRIGSYGEDVGELQDILNKWYPGLPKLDTDSRYGPKTAGRVQYLQRKAGINPDKIVGPDTCAVLHVTWKG